MLQLACWLQEGPPEPSHNFTLHSVPLCLLHVTLPVEPDNWLQVGKDAEMYVQWTLLLYAVYILYNTLELLKYADFIPMT